MNLLGIDYGEKRIGLAFADDLGFAFPLPAAAQGKKQERLAHLAEVIEQRKITVLVVGYPLNMDGSVGFKAREVDAFISLLERRFRLPVHRVDERLTTHQAQSDARASGGKGKRERSVRKRGDIDSRAAAIILQDFVDQQNLPVAPAPESVENP